MKQHALNIESLESRLSLSSDPIAILPLGDSITQAEYVPGNAARQQTSYRAPLQQMLGDHERYDFIGTQSTQCGGEGELPFPEFDSAHEGHWGWRADEILNGPDANYCGGDGGSGNLASWLSEYEVEPDIVLLHIGTNDIIQALPPGHTAGVNDLSAAAVQDVKQDIENIIDVLNANSTKPDFSILLATIIPGSLIREEAQAVNVEIQSIADANPNVTLVDQFANFDPATQTYDQVHPNASGEIQMASRWLDAIQSVESNMLRGDFSNNGSVGAEDIDLLANAIRQNDSSGTFDLNDDSQTDSEDLTVLVEEVILTRPGDANLDGVVAFDDFLTLSANFGQSATWSTGDFDGDGRIGFLDFLALSRNFGLPPLNG